MYALIRWWAKIFLGLYFRKTIIYDRDKVTLTGPLILASNHPSAFMEASVLSTVMPRPIHFLVRGDMFHPRFRWLFDWTKQIPIYRRKDGIANLRKNASTFELTYRKLGEGEAILIFPEAKTILEKRMRPVQRGTAHLAFGALPFIKENAQLVIQPVGVNFTDPRIPGTDVLVKFGEPFIAQKAKREDRDAIEKFTSQLSDALSPLIIQVDEDLEKNYDVASSIYYRMVHDNYPSADAHLNLKKIASVINDRSSINLVVDQTDDILKQLNEHQLEDAVYFPDLMVLGKPGLLMLTVLKICWLIAGGWIWRLVRSMIFSKIKTATFQGPTTLGVFMVVMPLVTLILLIIFLVAGVSLIWWLLWLLIMLAGTLIRPPLRVVTGLLSLKGNDKLRLKNGILNLGAEIEYMKES